MDLSGFLCVISLCMALRLIGFRFFRSAICPICQRDEALAKRELWRVLNDTSLDDKCVQTRQKNEDYYSISKEPVTTNIRDAQTPGEVKKNN